MRTDLPARSGYLRAYSPMRATGFTLIELLVVISIIATLAAMLLPAVATVKDMAKSSRCAAAQRQVGMAISVYCEDWDGLLPSLRRDVTVPPDTVTYWCCLIAPHLGFEPDGSDGTFTKEWKLLLVDSVLFGCPLQPRGTPAAKSSYGWNPFPLLPASYASSDWITGGPLHPSTSVRHFPCSQIGLRSARIMMGDCRSWFLRPPAGPLYTAVAGQSDPRIHRGRANYLMYDFRVASLDPASAWTAVNNPSSLP